MYHENREDELKKNIIILLRLAAPYILIILMPMMSVVSLGIWMVNDYHEQILQGYQRKAEIAFERFIQRTESIENLSYMISGSNIMVQYMISGKNRADHTVIENMELISLLKNSWINNDVEEIYFYEKKTNSIITSTTVLSNAEDYFHLVYKPEGNTPLECVEQLNGLLRGAQYEAVKNINIGNKVSRIIEYRVSLPMDALPSTALGQLVIAMNIEDIFGDFYDVMDTDCEFYVYDSKENLIFGSGNKYKDLMDLSMDAKLQAVESNGEKVFRMVCCSDDGKWIVNVFFSEAVLMGNRGSLGLPVLLLIIMPNVLGILLCIYFTFKNHREIQGILAVFRGENGEAFWEIDETENAGYKIIRKYTEKLVGENLVYKERIEKYEISRKQEVLYKLLHKDYTNSDEIIDIFANIDLNFSTGKCCLLCIRYMGGYYRTPVSEKLTAKDLVKNILSSLIEQNYEIFDSAARETICILTVDETENIEVVLQDIISRLEVEIKYNCGIEVEIVAGDIVDSMFQIHLAYNQAKEVLRYIESSGNEVALYSDYKKLKNRYYYPKDFDEKIYNYIVLGKSEEAKEIVRIIYEDNFVNCMEPHSMDTEVLIKNRLKESIISLGKKYDVSLEIMEGQLSEVQDIDSYFDGIYDCIDKLAEDIRNRKEVRQNQSAMKIINYVNENYCDNTLSLKQISQEFGFNETYVSTLFRKVYGEKFSVVIEELRIKRACELIRNTDEKISEIAQAVGYSSDASFRRAFKKITGVAPGEYREKNNLQI